VYRFVRAADDVADTPDDPDRVLARLGQWRRELDALYAGRAVHPYARRMARVVDRYQLSRAHFDELLAGLEADVRQPRLAASYAELHAHCEAVASSLAYLCLEILGADGEAERRYARDVGIALQLANILRDIGEDAGRGRIYLPLDELAAAGVVERDLLGGRMSPGLTAVCRRLADRARALVAGARRALDPEARRRLLVPEIWADVYLALLDELEAVDFDVFDRPPYLRRRRKLALALRRWARFAPEAEPARSS
jgi:15-cis-phytoene synthase